MKRNLSFISLLLCAPALAETPFVLDNADLRSASSGSFFGRGFPKMEQPATNLESPHGHPLDLSSDGKWLAAVNTYANQIELFETIDKVPQHRQSVFTGVDPVSVRFRNSQELWVVNHVSDSITIVEIPSGRVTRNLRTQDEPVDVVFSQSANKAYVSCSQVNRLLVYDLADLGAAPEEIPIEGEDPRSLSVSSDGRYVFAAVFESGNGTTILGGSRRNDHLLSYPPNVVNSPDGPYGGVNPPPNKGDRVSPYNVFNPLQTQPVGLIVRKETDGRWKDDNNGDWTTFVTGERAEESGRVPGWDLVDHDLAVINTETGDIHYAKGLMNICMAVDVNPSDGTISVVGTDAMNHVRYEPNLKGVFLRVQQAIVQLKPDGSTETIANKDLNPHLDYTTPSVAEAVRQRSLGDPRAIVWTRKSGKAFIAGMGSNNVIITDSKGDRLLEGRTIEVGEGPTGLALNEPEDRLYVLNRFEGSISVVDTHAGHELNRVPYFDPTPEVIKNGRKHLYDTHKNSGLGHVSCASCHVDARMDRLAWDLGNPLDKPLRRSRAVDVFETGKLISKTVEYSAIKGPMVTQTLQGIIGNGPLHWRGDQSEVEDFNVFFETLLGADQQLTDEEMAEFRAYLNTITFPPNPYRKTDHSMPEKVALPNQFAVEDGERVPLPDGDPVRGRKIFDKQRLEHFHGRDCLSCHQGSSSSGGYDAPELPPAVSELPSLTQSEFKPSQLRNLHEKIGFDAGSTNSLSGFGYLHDGSIDTLTRYLSQPQFEETASLQDVADTIAFLYFKNGANVPAPASAETAGIRNGIFSRDLDSGLRNILLGRQDALVQAMHAGVGTQFILNPEEDSPARPIQLRAFLSKVERSNATVSAMLHTEIKGVRGTWVYQTGNRLFVSDRREAASVEEILNREGFARGVITMVHPLTVPALIGDTDRDGLYDHEETRDLDPHTPGIQNPFDPFNPDSVGVNRSRPNSVADGLDDYDGDGVSNREEFIEGSNPIVPFDSAERVTFPIHAIPKNRGISLRWDMEPGWLYYIEQSKDLVRWETQSGPYNSRSQYSVGAGGGTRYFRVHRIPD